MKEIALTRGYVALVDDEDYAWLSQSRWACLKIGYASAKIDGKQCYMHRIITGAQPGQYVDHIDGNKLNNQRTNLRLCTCRQNHWNKPKQTTHKQWKGQRSIYKGVERIPNKWRARIKANGERIHIGVFDSEIEAAKAYDRMATKHFGEFAYLNFPEAQ
jgi:hypothetical protein